MLSSARAGDACIVRRCPSAAPISSSRRESEDEGGRGFNRGREKISPSRLREGRALRPGEGLWCAGDALRGHLR